mmetsp:Transcript_30273/g.83525  ORF Transcript_30273/g.83525 Transcript_30273/m.83525 type:complete len:98 (-) Transcript_30273:215-508(-)
MALLRSLSRVALVAALFVAVPLTSVMWNDLVARVRREVSREGFGSFVGKCAIAVTVALLHWLAARQKEEADEMVKQITESQDKAQHGPRVGTRPKAE